MFQAWPVKIITTAASSRPDVAAREQRHQRQDQPGHETQDRDALEDVQHRDEHSLGDAVLGRPVAVNQRESRERT